MARLGEYLSMSGYVFDCEYYCVGCAEQIAREREIGFTENYFISSEAFQPIFQSEEADYIPSCAACGDSIGITLTHDGIADLKARGLWTEALNMQYFGTIEIE